MGVGVIFARKLPDLSDSTDTKFLVELLTKKLKKYSGYFEIAQGEMRLRFRSDWSGLISLKQLTDCNHERSKELL